MYQFTIGTSVVKNEFTMKQEDKNLLFRDLCARLPYGIKAQIKYYDDAMELLAISTNGTTYATTHGDMECLIETFVEDCKPYLFPLSSMTEEQRTSHNFLKNSAYANPIKLIDFYIKNHFDYRGLIEKGLAIDATGLGIY